MKLDGYKIATNLLQGVGFITVLGIVCGRQNISTTTALCSVVGFTIFNNFIDFSGPKSLPTQSNPTLLSKKIVTGLCSTAIMLKILQRTGVIAHLPHFINVAGLVSSVIFLLFSFESMRSITSKEKQDHLLAKVLNEVGQFSFGNRVYHFRKISYPENHLVRFVINDARYLVSNKSPIYAFTQPIPVELQAQICKKYPNAFVLSTAIDGIASFQFTAKPILIPKQ